MLAIRDSVVIADLHYASPLYKFILGCCSCTSGGLYVWTYRRLGSPQMYPHLTVLEINLSHIFSLYRTHPGSLDASVSYL